MHDELVKRLRNCVSDTVEDCAGCPYQGGYKGTYCMNGLIAEAADAIEELSNPRWIPVTERLPEKYHQVLCYGVNGMSIDYYSGESSVLGRPLFMVSEARVTHWMPLPQPPQNK